jgi:hypothetical protein
VYIFANIDDCALIINDFLPTDLFKKIVNFNYNVTLDSHVEWDKTLYKDNQGAVTMKNVKFSDALGIIEKEKVKAINPIFEDFLKKQFLLCGNNPRRLKFSSYPHMR